MASLVPSDHGRLRLRRLRSEVLVAREHPAPERLAARLDATAARDLSSAVGQAARGVLAELRPGLWLVRRLDLAFEIDADWDAGAIARAWAAALAGALRTTLAAAGPAGDDVLWFPDRAAFAARFAIDLAHGRAWDRWCYDGFAGLRALPVSAALRTALGEAGRAWAILGAIAADGAGQGAVIAALTRADAGRVLAALAEQGGDAPASTPPWSALADALDAERAADATDEAPLALRLCARVAGAGGEGGKGGSAALVAAAQAVACLVRLAADTAPDTATRLLAAIARGDLGAAAQAAGGGAGARVAGALATLANAEPAARAAIARAVARRTGTPARAGTDAGDGAGGEVDAGVVRHTPFGGVFLLLPLLDEVPLDEATRGWPLCQDSAPAAALRLLLLAQALGGEGAGALFGDPVARDLAGVGPRCDPGALAVWAAGLPRAAVRAFEATLARWRRETGAVEGETLVLARAPLGSGHRLVLLDGARGQWVALGARGRRRSRRTSVWLAQARALVPDARVALLADQLDDAGSGGARAWSRVGALADAPDALADVVRRLPALNDDLAYLAPPRAWGLPPPSSLSFAPSPAFWAATTVAAQALLRAFAWRVPGFTHASLRYLHRNFLDVRASLEEEAGRRVVRLGSAPLHILLATTGMARASYRLAWCDDRPFTLFPAP